MGVEQAWIHRRREGPRLWGKVRGEELDAVHDHNPSGFGHGFHRIAWILGKLDSIVEHQSVTKRNGVLERYEGTSEMA